MSKKHEKYRYFIFVCKGKDCKKAGAKDVEKAFEQSVKKQGLSKSTKIFECACTSRCKEGPVAVVNNHWMVRINPEHVNQIVESSIDGSL
jgi:NADH:ubiquinone oxidoreductase subunit E